MRTLVLYRAAQGVVGNTEACSLSVSLCQCHTNNVLLFSTKKAKTKMSKSANTINRLADTNEQEACINIDLMSTQQSLRLLTLEELV